MPFKSESQRRKFAEMVKQGKLKQSEFDKWNSETPAGKLPERIGQKPEKNHVDEIRTKYKAKFGLK